MRERRARANKSSSSPTTTPLSTDDAFVGTGQPLDSSIFGVEIVLSDSAVSLDVDLAPLRRLTSIPKVGFNTHA